MPRPTAQSTFGQAPFFSPETELGWKAMCGLSYTLRPSGGLEPNLSGTSDSKRWPPTQFMWKCEFTSLNHSLFSELRQPRFPSYLVARHPVHRPTISLKRTD
ncbi:hypothetical protein CC2G_007455 [Coprinopsis cinerea AmutBmut pab1-1]|nr:hypothetical protein CC2G_007455 [Coprinopsis cinerea AmutBmut pab1-1]